MIHTAYQQEVEEMISLLREAAHKEILPRWGNVTAQTKGDPAKLFKDMVTEADLRASEYILDRIRRQFPGSYSEEHKFADRFSHDILWQIDPVDGTHEFCEGISDGYACHAALLKRQKDGTYFPVAGIIYLPGVDKMWHSNGSNDVVYLRQGVAVSLPPLPTDELAGFVRKVDPNDALIEFYHRLGRILGLPSRIVLAGGSGSSMSDLLEGRLNLFVMNYDYTKEWDLAMAEPLVHARGGFICDLDGNEFRYNRPDCPGKKEPYNLRGFIASITFKKQDILPHIPRGLLQERV